jgi:putative ABC transport system permease protein
VVSYVSSQRAHEIGVRMALGAAPGDILQLVLRDGLALVVLGLAAGSSASLASSRYLGSFLFGTSARDPLAFAGAALVLGCAALIACLIPAWRAARVDPTVTLRCE